MRDRLLVRHFLWRFLEHDFISANADRREALSVVGGAVISISLFFSALIAIEYQFSNFMPPGIASQQSVDDRFMFVTSSMFVMALLAVALWDALALDARDTAVLGILPLPRAVIVRSKYCAVALVAGAADLAWNLAPTLFRSASVPITLPIGFRGGLVLTLAQGTVTVAAGAFGFLSVVALREGLTAVLGQRHFRVVAAPLQAALVVVLTSVLLLLPATSRHVSRNWLAREGVASRILPPLWFVGLHEMLAGSVIDSLPRTRPDPYLVAQEREATTLYRSLWPRYHELGRTAVTALAVATLLSVIACAWNSRRLPSLMIHRRHNAAPGRLLSKWIVANLVARSPLQQAGFWFTWQSLSRRVTHRTTLASAIAVGLSLVAIAVRERGLAVQKDLASAPLALFAAQSLLLVSILTGFRHAAQLPAELRASGTFSLAWRGDPAPFLSGVKRAGWVALALPTLSLLFFWHAAMLGVRVAGWHAATGAAFSVLIIELLFLRYRRLPLVSGYAPIADLKSRGPMYVVAVLLGCYSLAWIEQTTLTTSSSAPIMLVVGIVAIAGGVAAYDRAWRSSAVILVDDDDSPLPTQRLNLAG